MRERHGTLYGNCLLTDEQVIEMKTLYGLHALSIRSLARKFRISKSSVHNLLVRKTYRVVASEHL
jgi:predicted DNA-binding protein YlxM (UPF0122 family)